MLLGIGKNWEVHPRPIFNNPNFHLFANWGKFPISLCIEKNLKYKQTTF